MNTLYLGDCLNVLRDNVPDESVDLIYNDPPFNSKRDYNIFFDDKEIQTQRIAFEDTWTLKNIQDSLAELHTLQTNNLYRLLTAYQEVAPHAFPYLTMMSLRILEMHRVLKPTGSFYLHCDPTMSHYLKTVCDVIFKSKYFKNEIAWCYETAGKSKKTFSKKHDVIFWYSKSDEYVFNPSDVSIPRKANKHMRMGVDENGREYEEKTDRKTGKIYRWYLDEGRLPFDYWVDIHALNREEKERLHYPTQKPKALLERIIKASSNEGDTVLDGFSGCGTTIDAAEGSHRNWIGIDISPIAISLVKRRLIDTYGEHLSKFEVRGTPTDEQSAIELSKQNPNAFQDWWLTEFEVFSTTFGTKGPDKGVDGLAQYLIDPATQKVIRAAFSVKGGENIHSNQIDELRGAMEKHKCELGVFLTVAEPTKPMLDTVAGSGFVEIPGYKIPRLQILTLKDYFRNNTPKLPQVNITFKAAQLKGKKKQNQMKMDI